MFRFLIAVSFILGISFTHAAEKEQKRGLYNESSLGYVVTGGNSESETTNIAQLLEYYWTKDILKFTGSYIQTEGTDQNTQIKSQTAENWMTNLRFEKVLTANKFNAYVSYGWYGDRFQGVREGQNADIGAKYFFYNTKETQLFAELGYRYARELLDSPASSGVGVGPRMFPEYHYARLYTQVDYAHSKTLGLGFWIEYLPSMNSFKDDQRINYSPYLTSVLTDMFSLKVAYLGRYRHKPAIVGNKQTDYTFTTSLIAKF